MALHRRIPHDSGYDIEYWIITRVRLDVVEGRINVEMRGYKDRGMRLHDPGGSTMAYRSYKITGDEFVQFVDIPAPQEFDWYDPAKDYNVGDEVQYNRLIYTAVEPVSAHVDDTTDDGTTDGDTTTTDDGTTDDGGTDDGTTDDGTTDGTEEDDTTDDLPGEPTDEGDIRIYPGVPDELLPENSDAWVIRSDGNVSRRDIYEYIKIVDSDFGDEADAV